MRTYSTVSDALSKMIERNVEMSKVIQLVIKQNGFTVQKLIFRIDT